MTTGDAGRLDCGVSARFTAAVGARGEIRSEAGREGEPWVAIIHELEPRMSSRKNGYAPAAEVVRAVAQRSVPVQACLQGGR